MRLKLNGNDNRGTLFLDGERIVREVDPAYMPTVLRVLERLEVLGDLQRQVIASRRLPGAELEHERLTISYPSEWSPSMLRDVTLLQLDLWIALRRVGLTLKDAIPTNYLFRGATPILVDILSIVPTDQIAEEQWLVGLARGGSLTEAILRIMFIPYFGIPLLLAAAGDIVGARRSIAKCIDPNGPRDSARAMLHSKSSLHRRLQALWRFMRLRRIARARDDDRSLRKLRHFVARLPVVPADRGYLNYYASKGEAFDYVDPGAWQPKQRSVADVLRRVAPRTVLDLGANTGWFSILAVRSGASVVATDVDVACVDALYRKALAEGLPLLPLHLTFGELEQSVTGVDASHAKAGPNAPLSPSARLKSDLVLCLGLLHHLTLGEGRTLGEALDTLRALTERACLVEFIALDDPLVAGRHDYFPKLANFPAGTYDVAVLEREVNRRFGSLERLPSHPETRSLWLLHA